MPLAIGMALNNKDSIYTGPGSRALLRLADGSLIKLGENGSARARRSRRRKNSAPRNVVTASLDVVSGAFRFTTQALSRFRGERDVKVRIVTITAGIRGTDLWGKADATRDIVCLIEGRITVARGKEAFTMDQPMSFYIAPQERAAAAGRAGVAGSSSTNGRRKPRSRPARGAMRKGGKWRVYLAEANNQERRARGLRPTAQMPDTRPKSGPVKKRGGHRSIACAFRTCRAGRKRKCSRPSLKARWASSRAESFDR